MHSASIPASYRTRIAFGSSRSDRTVPNDTKHSECRTDSNKVSGSHRSDSSSSVLCFCIDDHRSRVNMLRKGKHLCVPHTSSFAYDLTAALGWTLIGHRMQTTQLTSSLQGTKKTHRIDPIGRLHMSEFQMTLDDARYYSEDQTRT